MKSKQDTGAKTRIHQNTCDEMMARYRAQTPLSHYFLCMQLPFLFCLQSHEVLPCYAAALHVHHCPL